MQTTDASLPDDLNTLRDLAGLNKPHFNITCEELAQSILDYFHHRVLSDRQAEQEERWQRQLDLQSGRSSTAFIILLCAAGSATVATMLSWWWTAALLAIGVCGVSLIYLTELNER